MYSIVDGSFDIFKDVVGASSQDNSGQFAVLSISLEDHDLFRCDFLDGNVVRGTSLIRGGCF